MTKFEKVIKGLELLKQRLILQTDVLGYGEHISDIDNTLELLKAKDINVPTKWISVKVRLPEESGEYLVIKRSGHQDVLAYSARHRAFNSYDIFDEPMHKIEVTHWMPLPEPPKEEDDDRNED